MAKLGEFARALKLVSLIFALALGFASVNAKADDSYPNRPVRIIVSFSAGGPTDIVGRVFAPKLTELLGQQFFVENKVGAGGNIGADQVAKSPPDGYTLLVATVSTHAINPGLYARCRTIRSRISRRSRRSASRRPRSTCIPRSARRT